MTLIVSLCFISIGLWLFYWASRQDKLMHRSHQWPRVPGKVLVSEILDAKPHRDEYSTLSFLYTFEVNAQTYTGEKINHFELEKNIGIEEMRAFVHQYPAQTQIQVTYKPEDPTDCVLLVNDTRGKTGAKGLGTILLMLGAFIAYLTMS